MHASLCAVAVLTWCLVFDRIIAKDRHVTIFDLLQPGTIQVPSMTLRGIMMIVFVEALWTHVAGVGNVLTAKDLVHCILFKQTSWQLPCLVLTFLALREYLCSCFFHTLKANFTS